MINTDKYEGHTEGPWFIEYEENNGMRVFICSKGATILWQCETTHTDAQLIADAPLLLAEVEQLREEKTFLWETYLKESAEVKRLREAIQQIIEYNEGVDVDMFGSQVSDKLKEMIE